MGRREAGSWATWAEGCSQPQGPHLLLGTSPGPRDLSSSPRSASFCSVTVSQSPSPLGPQFAYLYSERLGSDSKSQRLEFLLLSPRPSVNCESYRPFSQGFSIEGRDRQCLKGRRKTRPGSWAAWRGGMWVGQGMEEELRAGHRENSKWLV